MFYWERLTKGDIRPKDYRWGTFGPSTLTHLARKYAVAGRAKAPSVFYPVMHYQVDLFLRPPELVESLLTAETRTVHLWQSVLRRKTSRGAARIILGIGPATARNQRGISASAPAPGGCKRRGASPSVAVGR